MIFLYTQTLKFFFLSNLSILHTETLSINPKSQFPLLNLKARFTLPIVLSNAFSVTEEVLEEGETKERKYEKLQKDYLTFPVRCSGEFMFNTHRFTSIKLPPNRRLSEELKS